MILHMERHDRQQTGHHKLALGVVIHHGAVQSFVEALQQLLAGAGMVASQHIHHAETEGHHALLVQEALQHRPELQHKVSIVHITASILALGHGRQQVQCSRRNLHVVLIRLQQVQHVVAATLLAQNVQTLGADGEGSERMAAGDNANAIVRGAYAQQQNVHETGGDQLGSAHRGEQLQQVGDEGEQRVFTVIRSHTVEDTQVLHVHEGSRHGLIGHHSNESTQRGFHMFRSGKHGHGLDHRVVHLQLQHLGGSVLTTGHGEEQLGAGQVDSSILGVGGHHRQHRGQHTHLGFVCHRLAAIQQTAAGRHHHFIVHEILDEGHSRVCSVVLQIILDSVRPEELHHSQADIADGDSDVATLAEDQQTVDHSAEETLVVLANPGLVFHAHAEQGRAAEHVLLDLAAQIHGSHSEVHHVILGDHGTEGRGRSEDSQTAHETAVQIHIVRELGSHLQNGLHAALLDEELGDSLDLEERHQHLADKDSNLARDVLSLEGTHQHRLRLALVETFADRVVVHSETGDGTSDREQQLVRLGEGLRGEDDLGDDAALNDGGLADIEAGEGADQLDELGGDLAVGAEVGVHQHQRAQVGGRGDAVHVQRSLGQAGQRTQHHAHDLRVLGIALQGDVEGLQTAVVDHVRTAGSRRLLDLVRYHVIEGSTTVQDNLVVGDAQLNAAHAHDRGLQRENAAGDELGHRTQGTDGSALDGHDGGIATHHVHQHGGDLRLHHGLGKEGVVEEGLEGGEEELHEIAVGQEVCGHREDHVHKSTAQHGLAVLLGAGSSLEDDQQTTHRGQLLGRLGREGHHGVADDGGQGRGEGLHRSQNLHQHVTQRAMRLAANAGEGHAESRQILLLGELRDDLGVLDEVLYRSERGLGHLITGLSRQGMKKGRNGSSGHQLVVVGGVAGEHAEEVAEDLQILVVDGLHALDGGLVALGLHHIGNASAGGGDVQLCAAAGDEELEVVSVLLHDVVHAVQTLVVQEDRDGVLAAQSGSQNAHDGGEQLLETVLLGQSYEERNTTAGDEGGNAGLAGEGGLVQRKQVCQTLGSLLPVLHDREESRKEGRSAHHLAVDIRRDDGTEHVQNSHLAGVIQHGTVHEGE